MLHLAKRPLTPVTPDPPGSEKNILGFLLNSHQLMNVMPKNALISEMFKKIKKHSLTSPYEIPGSTTGSPLSARPSSRFGRLRAASIFEK